jgi:hypothetical protein
LTLLQTLHQRKNGHFRTEYLFYCVPCGMMDRGPVVKTAASVAFKSVESDEDSDNSSDDAHSDISADSFEKKKAPPPKPAPPAKAPPPAAAPPPKAPAPAAAPPARRGSLLDGSNPLLTVAKQSSMSDDDDDDDDDSAGDDWD